MRGQLQPEVNKRKETEGGSKGYREKESEKEDKREREICCKRKAMRVALKLPPGVQRGG